MEEIWKPVVGYEGHYEVSNLGRVKSFRRPNPRIRPSYDLRPNTPHQMVRLHVNKRSKGCYVHTLVLEAFVGPRPPGMVAAHLDGNPRNNVVSNLAWVTSSENAMHMHIHGTMRVGMQRHSAKVTEKDVRDIRKLYAQGMRVFELIKKYPLTHQSMTAIVRGKKWKHVI